jgi:hypothetical protein
MMAEKVEWEVVDVPQPHAQSQSSSYPQPNLQHLLKTILGPWWRWKVAGIVSLAGVVLVLFAMVTGVVAILMTAGIATVLVIGKASQWVRQRKQPPSS